MQVTIPPDTVHPVGEAHFQQFCEKQPERVIAPDLSLQLRQLLSCSDFAFRVLCRQPELAEVLWQEGLAAPRHFANWQQTIDEVLSQNPTEAELMRSFRQLRQREMLRIAWRDLLAYAPLETVLRELSELAEAFIQGAQAYAKTALLPRFGEACDTQGQPQEMLIIGMGKLGGRELNFSSDIDLIFAYPESGQTNGRKSVDNAEYYTRLGQRVVKLLNECTEDGFVYRVDMRLRPFGASGPLALSFDALENYYLAQAREWERYAMVKARALTGGAPAIEQFEQLLRPFVYRRYIDYGVIEALADLKTKIAAQVVARGQEHSVKLGLGGIREIEFIAQSFQLLRGARDLDLQRRGLLTVLHYLGELSLLEGQELKTLSEAYGFLRLLENRLQMLGDQQTHVLPDKPEAQARIALSMGYADWAAMRSVLGALQHRVNQIFQTVFATEQGPDSSDPLLALWVPDLDAEGMSRVLQSQGLADADALAQTIYATVSSRAYASLSTRAKQRYETVMPLMLRESLKHPNTTETAARLLELMRAVSGRSVYLQMLIQSPSALALLARLFSASRWLSEFVVSHPLVIDELLDPDQFAEGLDREAMACVLSERLSKVDPDDQEAQLDALRHFKQAQMMRIVVADLLNHASVMQVSDQLTWLAEVLLNQAVTLAQQLLSQRHGWPRYRLAGQTHRAQLGVVAYGKLGGIELGYGSDLDIVFVHDSQGEAQQSDGDKPLSNGQYFARLSQKVVHLLSTRTTAGTVYEVDTRLRPNGQSGLTVISLPAYRDYLLKEAWTWEHQALVRTRLVVGDQALAEDFARIRYEVLALPRDAAEPQKSVRDMRERMRSELSQGNAQTIDLKQDPGGVADIEFLVQYALLRFSAEVPQLAEHSDVVRQLEQLMQAQRLEPETCHLLQRAYLFFREQTHAAALQAAKAQVPRDARVEQHTQAVLQQWQQLMLSPPN